MEAPEKEERFAVREVFLGVGWRVSSSSVMGARVRERLPLLLLIISTPCIYG